MRLELIVGLQVLIIAFIVYIVTIPFAGWFEAFVAKQMGDDAPEDAGFLTLNPLEHFNVFGFAALLWSIFFSHLLPFQFIPGWGRYIPLIPDNIRGAHYKARILAEYLSRSLAHLFILICAAATMTLVYGAIHVHGMMLMKSGQLTSFDQALISLFSFFYYQNLILFVIHFIVGVFKYIIYFHMPRAQEISFTTIMLGFILLFIGLSIFGPLLQSFAFKLTEGIQALLLKVIQ